MAQRSTPSWLLPGPARRLREHLREIRRLSGSAEQRLSEVQEALTDQLQRVDALVRAVGANTQTEFLGTPARMPPRVGPVLDRFDYEAAVAELVTAGASEQSIRFGSIAQDSVEFITGLIGRELATDRPAVGLHVGNFVGISLAAFACALRDLHPESLTVAVDPGVSVHGTALPQDHVMQLLDLFGLTGSVLVACGYSFGRTDPESQGANPNFAGLADRPRAVIPPSGENVLPILARLGARYDVALLDGNHRGATVSAELRYLSDTLRPGGLVFLDDVSDWEEIRAVYRDPGAQFERAADDGRVGVLRLLA